MDALLLTGLLVLVPPDPDSVGPLTRRVLVQEKFVGGTYLESGVLLGTGTVFFPLRGDVRSSVIDPDTVYLFAWYSGPEGCLEFVPEPDCMFAEAGSREVLHLGSRALVRRLGRASLHPDRIRALGYRAVRSEFRVCAITRGSHVFVNHAHRRKGDPVLVLRDVVKIWIMCP